MTFKGFVTLFCFFLLVSLLIIPIDAFSATNVNQSNSKNGIIKTITYNLSNFTSNKNNYEKDHKDYGKDRDKDYDKGKGKDHDYDWDRDHNRDKDKDKDWDHDKDHDWDECKKDKKGKHGWGNDDGCVSSKDIWKWFYCR